MISGTKDKLNLATFHVLEHSSKIAFFVFLEQNTAKYYVLHENKMQQLNRMGCYNTKV
jgi:hypothetical protein